MGFDYGNVAEMEVYINDELVNSKFEVWIPLVKKISSSSYHFGFEPLVFKGNRPECFKFINKIS